MALACVASEDFVNPLLFAVVDAVLWSAWRDAVFIGVHPIMYRQMRSNVGWWRSTWQR